MLSNQTSGIAFRRWIPRPHQHFISHLCFSSGVIFPIAPLVIAYLSSILANSGLAYELHHVPPETWPKQACPRAQVSLTRPYEVDAQHVGPRGSGGLVAPIRSTG
jgi:hypothetical protein